MNYVYPTIKQMFEWASSNYFYIILISIVLVVISIITLFIVNHRESTSFLQSLAVYMIIITIFVNAVLLASNHINLESIFNDSKSDSKSWNMPIL